MLWRKTQKASGKNQTFKLPGEYILFVILKFHLKLLHWIKQILRFTKTILSKNTILYQNYTMLKQMLQSKGYSECNFASWNFNFDESYKTINRTNNLIKKKREWTKKNQKQCFKEIKVAWFLLQHKSGAYCSKQNRNRHCHFGRRQRTINRSYSDGKRRNHWNCNKSGWRV